MRKSELTRSYAPDFVSAETLAYRLDCSVRTIEHYCRANLLPPPVMIGNLVRWRWSDVEQHIARLHGLPLADNGADGDGTPDQYSSAVRRHARPSSKEAASD